MIEAGVVATALASALAAASSSILQHHSARRAPSGGTTRLVGHLLTRPVWIAGLVAALIGLALHVVALAHGQLAVVQPLLISGVLFALPVSALMEGRRPSAREWLLALVLVAGLATFLLAGRPSAGVVGLDADVLAWSSVAILLPVGALTLAALRWPHGHAPALLGAAAGIAYGLVAALIKEATALDRTGIGHVFSDWPVYVLIASGGVALVLTQLAYRAGPLAQSMPALTVSDPAASVVLGIAAFQERVSSSPVAVTLQIVGFVVMSVAAAQLARREPEGGRVEQPVQKVPT
jgi:drug/metabolite transporter (DMT)-like permease